LLERRTRALRSLRLSLHHVPEAVFLVARDARVLDVSLTACRQLEYTRRELLSMRIYDFDPDYPQHLWDELWEDHWRRKSLVIETRHRTKSGRLIPVEIAIKHFTAGGEQLAISVVRDITQRRAADAALREKQAEILELSVPILRVSDGVLALPVVGSLDAARAARMMERLLQALVQEQARTCILDLTGVDAVDATTAGQIVTIGRAVHLLGSRCLLSGIAPHVARAVVELELELGALVTFGTLRDALAYALEGRGAAGAPARRR
jgi:rsbT co-antagonist protein RsbR